MSQPPEPNPPPPIGPSADDTDGTAAAAPAATVAMARHELGSDPGAMHSGAPRPPAEAIPWLPDGRLDLETVVTRYQTPLLRYAGQLLGGTFGGAGGGGGVSGSSEAEDVVQEAFMRLHRYVAAGQQPEIQNLTSWLFRVAHNLTMDARRRRQRQQKVRNQAVQQALAQPDGPTQADTSLDDLELKEACTRAMAELHRLPDDQRQVLLLKVIQGLTLREVAEITGLSISNVAYRMTQGLRELSRRLKEAGVV